MQTSTNTINLLYITSQTSDGATAIEAWEFDGMELSLATIADSAGQLGTQSADCLLLSDQLEQTDAVSIVQQIRTGQPAVPIVAFTDTANQQFIEELLDAGVSDVITDSAETAPPRLVRTRIESVVEAADSIVRERLLAEFHEREEMFRQVSESINDVVWVNTLDEDGLTFVNRAYEEVWGRPREELYESRDAVLEGIHPDDQERVREAMESQLDSPEDYDITYRVVQPDGDIRWVRSSAFGIRENGELVRIVGVARDITERKDREEELAAERDLIERMLEASPVGIVVIDTDGTIVRANEQAGTILGVPQDELEGGSYAPETLQVRKMDGTPMEPDEFPFQRIKATDEPLWDEEMRIEKPSGEQAIISVDGVPIVDDGDLERVLLTFDDVTERVERAKQLTEQRDELAQLDHLNRIIRGVDKALLGATSRQEVLQAVCDKLSNASRYRFAIVLDVVGDRLEPTAWTDTGTEFVDEVFPITGVTTETSPGKRAAQTGETQVIQEATGSSEIQRWVEIWQSNDVESLAAIPISYEGQDYGVLTVYATQENAFSDREQDVLDELGGTVGHAIAAIESRQREQTLTSLYEATEDLLAADTAEDVSDVVVDTAVDVLELSGIGIFLFDDDENVLHPAAATDTLLDSYSESRVFGPGKKDSITWNTYVTGEKQFFRDVRESDRLANPETAARSALLIPLGDHGVFVALSTETGAFDDHMRQLVGLLAATTEAALDRVAGQADIRERERELQHRTERLERFESVFELSRELSELLRNATTREKIETETCRKLLDIDCVTFAWVGQVPPDSDTIEPRAWAGSEDGYLDSVTFEVGGEEPAASTAATGTTTRVLNVTDHLRDAPWARQAVDRDYQSVISVPLSYGGTTYGILTVYANSPETFAGIVGESATELAKTIAYGIKSVETRRGILSEKVTELQLRIDDPDTFPNAIAAIADEEVSYREIEPTADGSAHVLFELSDPPVSEILALESEFVTVESLTHVQRGNQQLFRATLSGQTVPATLFDCGSIPRTITASATEINATVRIPRELSVRVFLDRVRDRYPETELVSRQDVERTADAREDVAVALEENLTERQREVLVTAYESGFFQSPRETTGAELADLLDLSQPTVTHHLREAQRRLFTALFDETDDPSTADRRTR